MTDQDSGRREEAPVADTGTRATKRSKSPRKGRGAAVAGVVVTLVVLVLLAGGIFYFTRAIKTRPTVVPNVLRMTEPAAATQLTAAGFRPGLVTQVATGSVGVGLVVTQEPVANATAPRGSAVNLALAVAPINTSTPKLIGMTQADAVALLEGALFIPGHYREYSDKVPAGTVAEQLPEPGIPIQTGTRVFISVSLGPGTGSTVPNIVGMLQPQATAALTKAGLRPVWTYSTLNPRHEAFQTVLDQAPNPGTVVPAGEAVAAVVTVAQE